MVRAAAYAAPTVKYQMQIMYARIYVWLVQAQPWIMGATCLLTDVVTDVSVPGCDVLPNIPKQNYLHVGPGNPIYEATRFVRWMGETIIGPAVKSGTSNLSAIRFTIGGKQYLIWGVAGERSRSLLRFERLIGDLGMELAPLPFFRRFTPSDSSRAFDTEVKLLEEAARIIDESGIGSGQRLSLQLFTERRPCHSCGGEQPFATGSILSQFTEWATDEKGIKLNLEVMHGDGPVN